MLTEISKHHSYWVELVKQYGEQEYSEDIVQEMYLRIHKLGDSDKLLTDGKANKAYIRILLRNMTYTYHQTIKRIDKVRIGEGFTILNEENEDTIAYGKFLQRLDREMTAWTDFDRNLFKIYIGTYGSQKFDTYGEGIAMRKLSKDTGIALMTIFLTVKRCKQKIKENLNEDWQDYINNDWELL
jgi:DNA-directed RNA polymerase specialized sigma24 family protein